MSEFEKTCHLELPPEIDILQNGRRRVTRRFELGKNGNVDDVIYRAYGDADPATITSCTTGYANLKLIAQKVQPRRDKEASLLVQVFETLTGAWVPEIDDVEIVEENGLRGVTRRLIALPGTDFSAFVVGTSTYDGLTLTGLQVERTDGFWRLILGYGAAGVTSRSTNESNNGKLSTITIESRNEVPATPSGYVLVATQVVNEEGFETTRYTFVRGNGEISRQTDTSNNGALSTISIRHLSAPSVVTTPISTPSGYVLVSESVQEADGHRVWSASFARGDGQISEETQGQGDSTVKQIRYISAPSVLANPIPTPSGFLLLSVSMQEADGHRVWSASYGKGTDTTDFELNGLRRVTQVRINAVGTSIAGFVVGTSTITSGGDTLYLATFRSEENEIFQRNVAEYLEPGVVSREERLLDGGIKQTTVRSFYTLPTIANAIYVSLTQENELGYPVWQRVGLTKLNGTSLTTGVALSTDTLEIFTYPGRAKLYQKNLVVGLATFKFYDLYLSPPIEALISATTDISYQTTDAPPNLTGKPLWSPTEWASLRAQYLTNTSPSDAAVISGARSRVEALRGYLVAEPQLAPPSPIPTQGITFSSSVGSLAIAFGDFMNTGLPGEAIISGGPVVPGGSTWTLKWDVQPAFVGTDGTQYYRVSITYAAVPSQPALPV
jgi:hypothetical protein